MRIELPLIITYNHEEDKQKAEILVVLIKSKLCEPKYYKKLLKLIDEARLEIMKEILSPKETK